MPDVRGFRRRMDIAPGHGPVQLSRDILQLNESVRIWLDSLDANTVLLRRTCYQKSWDYKGERDKPAWIALDALWQEYQQATNNVCPKNRFGRALADSGQVAARRRMYGTLFNDAGGAYTRRVRSYVRLKIMEN